MENPILTELTNLEQLAKLRIDRIRELQEQIKSRREMAKGYLRAAGEPSPKRTIYLILAANLTNETDALQATLDALLRGEKEKHDS